jgi:hypothetical protein
MFRQAPKFFDVGDVINLNGEKTPTKKETINIVNTTPKQDKITITEDLTPKPEMKPSRFRTEKDFVFKYAGDDIPWII